MDKKNRIPIQKRSLDTKNRIIDAGEYLFSKKGFYKTNSKEIAKEAGVAIGSFYAYFKDKKSVLIETIQRYNDKIFLIVKDFRQNENNISDPQMFIKKLIYTVIEAHNILPDFHEEIIYLMHTDSEIRKIMKNRAKESLLFTVNLLNQFKNAIKREDINIAAELITIAIEETVHHIIFNKPQNKDKIIEELTIMVNNYLF